MSAANPTAAAQRSRTHRIAVTAMLSAAATVLMFLEFPIPFLIPSFVELDFSELPALLAAAPADAFVIGGSSVYQALLDRCDTAYITKIDRAFPGADSFFPNLDALPQWRIVEEGPELEEQGMKFRYVTYRRR